MHPRRRTVQRQHARRGRSAERRGDAEPLARLGQQRIVAARKAGAHFAEGASACLRSDTVEHVAGDVAFVLAPVGGARGDQVGLRAQDHAVLDDLEAVGSERRAGRGDVDDEFGRTGGRRGFGRAELSTIR